jgi:hypothetical protein
MGWRACTRSGPGSARALRGATCRRGSLRLGLTALLAAGLVAGCGKSHAARDRASASLLPTVGTGPSTAAGTSAPVEPVLSAAEFEAIMTADRATVARDRGCSALATNTVPITSKGSPDQALRSILGVLRRPATPADRFSVKAPVLPGEGPGGSIGSRAPPGADVYVNASRRARTALGVTFYILPAGEETGLRPTPARCDTEQATALVRILRPDPKALVRRILGLQHEYLAWQRYEALNPEGIFLMTINAKASGNDGGASTAQIAQQGLLDGNAGYPVRALMSGVVPDGVASVTLRYRGARPVTASVVSNIFVAVPPRGTHRLASVVWRSSAGAVIKVVPNSIY